MVGDGQLPDFQVLIERNEISSAGLNFLVLRPDDAVAHPLPAAVILELVARGLPARRPELLAIIVANVDITSSEIKWHVVVARTRDPPQPRVAIKRVPSRRIGNDSEVRLATEVVNPRQRRVRLCDDVLTTLVVEV